MDFLPVHIQEEFSVSIVPQNKTIPDIIQSFIENQSDFEDSFSVCDLGLLFKKFQQWKQFFPRVQPYYAIKCNPDRALLKTLSHLGVKFDCASKNEIEMALSIPGVTSNDIIYANPCKQRSHIRYAQMMGISRMTFDNETELHKVKAIHPEAELLLRIMTDDSHAQCRLSSKFGAHLSDCWSLLQLGVQLGLKIVGISFHVGSGQNDVSAFTDAIRRAKKVFEMAEKLGIHMSVIDIGGGFPGEETSELSFKNIANAMAPLLDETFPNCELIAEPGRYFASSCCTLATNVIAKRKVNSDTIENFDQNLEDRQQRAHSEWLYYLNEGLYGSFNNLLYDHAHIQPKALISGNLHQCTLFGPTCDGFDCVSKSSLLPELDVGDWLYFEQMGAYTTAASSRFNGFEVCKTFYIYRQ